MKKKKIIIAIVCIFVLWIAVGIVDYGRVHSFEKPIFCVGTELADDVALVNMLVLGIPLMLRATLCPKTNFQE